MRHLTASAIFLFVLLAVPGVLAVPTNDNAPACTATKCESAAPAGGCKCGGNLCSESSYCYTTMSRCESFESCSKIVYEKEGKTVQASVIPTANSLERMISLKAGWNLISQPFTKFVTTTDCVPRRIYAFDADAQNYVWVGSFGEMSGGRGYFVQVDSDCYIRFVGSQKASSVRLKNGWNLVGTAFNKEMSLNDIISYCSISAKMWGFGTSIYAEASTLTPGMGYFVKYSGTDDNRECTVYSTDTDSSTSTSTTTTTTIPTLNGGQCPANCGGFVGSCQCGTFTCVSGNGLANSYCCPATASGSPMCYASQSYCTSVCPASTATTTTTTTTTVPAAAPTTTTTLPLCPYGSSGACADNAQGCGGTCASGYRCTSGACCCQPVATTTTTTTIPSCPYQCVASADVCGSQFGGTCTSSSNCQACCCKPPICSPHTCTTTAEVCSRDLGGSCMSAGSSGSFSDCPTPNCCCVPDTSLPCYYNRCQGTVNTACTCGSTLCAAGNYCCATYSTCQPNGYICSIGPFFLGCP